MTNFTAEKTPLLNFISDSLAAGGFSQNNSKIILEKLNKIFSHCILGSPAPTLPRVLVIGAVSRNFALFRGYRISPLPGPP